LSLDVFFNARSVAIIGASERPGSLGRALMTNLLEKFKGEIYPINVKYNRVFGLKCYKSILEVPGSVDLAVVAIPAASVPRVVDECGRKGVKGVVVISAGFREVGPEGAKLEEELVSVVRKHSMRLIGPNCLGVYDAHTGLDTIFNPSDRQGKPEPGNVAFISQSGALGAALLDWLKEEGIGLSKFISYGNAADVDEADLISYLAEDPRTEIIAAYIEGVRDGRRFVEAVRKAIRANKPVIVLKAGKSEKGMKAVASHTGSLAGAYEVYKGALKQSGALIVDDLHELLIAIKALRYGARSRGPNVAIVTNGGGAGVLATDSIESLGLRVAELSKETIDELRSKLPPTASPLNPVDILGDAPADRYELAIKSVLSDEKVDMVMVIALMQSPALDADELIKILERVCKESKKPIVFVGPGGAYASKRLVMASRIGIPSFKDPVEAAKALRYIYDYSVAYRKLTRKKGAK